MATKLQTDFSDHIYFPGPRWFLGFFDARSIVRVKEVTGLTSCEPSNLSATVSNNKYYGLHLDYCDVEPVDLILDEYGSKGARVPKAVKAPKMEVSAYLYKPGPSHSDSRR